jgi:hypothetical protein
MLKNAAPLIIIAFDLMKRFCKAVLITGFVLIGTCELQAQTTDNKLNQVDLMKKFVGRWKCELGKDNAPFKFRFEFKNADTIVQTAIQNDKVNKEITLTRIKNEK